MQAISIRNLTKNYGKSRGITDVTFDVKRGDFFGFIGPNGAGKSTTIRLLTGLLNADFGSINLLGHDITKDRISALSKIGYLPAETSFYKGMRASELFTLSAKLRGKDCKSEVKTLCERLDLDPSKKMETLSLGNRKKVGIICALMHRPELYIFDEPTSGLDPIVQREFYSLLTERNKEGATVFLSSHVLSEIARYCKNAAVIKDGRILACDSIQNLGHTGVKRIFLKNLSGEISHPDVRDLNVSGETTRFLFSGNAKSLVDFLSTLSFEDVTVVDPDLEEVFMHFYTKEGK